MSEGYRENKKADAHHMVIRELLSGRYSNLQRRARQEQEEADEVYHQTGGCY